MASTNWAGEDANANHRRVSDRNGRQAKARQQQTDAAKRLKANAQAKDKKGGK